MRRNNRNLSLTRTNGDGTNIDDTTENDAS
jgi:hypothetical protein